MIIPLDQVPCPECSATGAGRTGVQPLYVVLECRGCGLTWHVSG